MADTQELYRSFTQALSALSSRTELNQLKTTYLGRNGLVNKLFSEMSSVPDKEKKEFGKTINNLKTDIESAIAKREKELLTDTEPYTDITLPGTRFPQGHLHLVTYAIEEITRIFSRIGFIRMNYPEVEWDYFSFEALNIPKTHPARDEFETFFIDTPESDKPKEGKMILTPHTSSGQIREMLRVEKPPIRMINIAKTYRPNWDTTHTPMFHQFEGMCVDKDITITDLKGTIDYFAKEFFGHERETRLRPYHFQFTEPSFEVDISCGVCNGTGVVNESKCKVCKTGWLELGGAGMVHPKVLVAGGIDPGTYRGWAFGIGVERVIMMKEGISLDDLRIMYSGDIRFLEQF